MDRGRRVSEVQLLQEEQGAGAPEGRGTMWVDRVSVTAVAKRKGMGRRRRRQLTRPGGRPRSRGRGRGNGSSGGGSGCGCRATCCLRAALWGTPCQYRRHPRPRRWVCLIAVMEMMLVDCCAVRLWQGLGPRSTGPRRRMYARGVWVAPCTRLWDWPTHKCVYMQEHGRYFGMRVHRYAHACQHMPWLRPSHLAVSFGG